MFGKEKETKEEKAERKQLEMMQKYGMEDLTDERDYASVRKIMEELYGTGMMEAGMKLSMAPAADTVKISYLRAIMEQNFIIIRELDRLNKNLEQ